MKFILYLLCILLAPGVAVAAKVADLYGVDVLVEDQSSPERLKGMSAAMREVLVRVSGSRKVLQRPELAAAIAAPGRYIQGYRYTVQPPSKQNVLNLKFSPKALQQLLVNQQLPVWSEQRPEVLLWMAVQERKRRYILKDSAVRLPNVAVKNAAVRRGLPLAWPLDSDIEAGKVKVADIVAGFEGQIVQASKDYTHHGILLAYVKQLRGGRWQSRWQLIRNGHSTAWESEVGELQAVIDSGIDSVADILAAEFALSNASGQALQPLRVRVDKIVGLTAYAKSRAYLESLLVTDTVAVALVNESSVEYQLGLRSQAEEFERAIRLGGKMRIVPQVVKPDAINPAERNPAVLLAQPDYVLELIQ